LATKIIACYNAKACVKPHCWDNTPLGNLQYFVDKKNGNLKPGTIPVIRSSLKTVIQVVGGVKSIFPLFAQLGKALDQGWFHVTFFLSLEYNLNANNLIFR
jgi:hypothetical protein